MDRILKGLLRFQKDVYPRERELFERLSGGQYPEALLMTCADSRISPELITQTGPGDLFVCRNAGNIVPPHGNGAAGVDASVDYALEALGVRHIIVCGHSDCGAMKAVLNPELVKGLPTVGAWLRHADAARAIVERLRGTADGHDLLNRLIEENVLAQLHNLRTYPSVASRERYQELFLHGWVYDIKSGRVRAWDEQARAFLPVAEPVAAHAGSVPPELFV